VNPAKKPTWQQATALVSLSTCGAVTGFAFAHGTVSDMTSPTRMPVHLLALDKPAQPESTSDSALRSAIVKVASNYLRMAQTRSPSNMEAMIWGTDSVDGVDHGESCAAFASLTLALGAQAVGQQSWVTGGATYPWPLHQWADVRVDPNPDSPQIISLLQDAQAHGRWHPLGDGYQPQAGDWVLFDGHVEVVTAYSGGVLSTIGGDSAPNLSVNAHQFSGSLAAQGITGFVNNGDLPSQPSAAGSGGATAAAAGGAAAGGTAAGGTAAGGVAAGGVVTGGMADGAVVADGAAQGQGGAVTASAGQAAVPGTQAALTAKTNRTGPAAGRGAAARKGTARMTGTANGAGGVGTASMVPMPGLVAAGQGNGAAGQANGAAGQGSGAAGQGSGAAGQGSGAASGSRSSARAGVPAKAGSAGRAGSSERADNGRRTGSSGRGSTASRAGTSSRAGQGARAGQPQRAQPGSAAIPGAVPPADTPTGGAPAATAPSYTRNNPPAASTHVPGTASQQAFISEVAPGAIAAQSRYGIPAAVTIAQAIDESGWGQSVLAIRDHNLFGIKGSGPAGSDVQPTQEFQNGQWVTISAPFRIYHNVAESIADHSQLLATGPSYQQAMADRHVPDAFATDLTGVYATDPQYGANLIAIMRLYNLYRYDSSAPAAPAAPASPAAPAAAATPAAAAPTAAAAVPGVPSARAAAPSQAGMVADGGIVGQGGVPASGVAASGGTASGRTASQNAGASQNGSARQDAGAGQNGPARQNGSGGRGRVASPSRTGGQGRTGSQGQTGSGGQTGSRGQTGNQGGSGSQGRGSQGTASIPGYLDAYTTGPVRSAPAQQAAVTGRAQPGRHRAPRVAPRQARTTARVSRYVPQMPRAVTTAFLTSANAPLSRAEPLYQDVASRTGIRWQLLAACDWMQCKAQPRYSPVHGEKLGTVNDSGTTYRTKSEALAQCASDLVELAMAVYWIDITAQRPLAVRDLAKVFAAFRWGGLLKLHGISAMEFPYSVEGLTEQHVKMRWPDIKEPNAPDKPGTRFRMPFGAVPVVLSLRYPALA